MSTIRPKSPQSSFTYAGEGLRRHATNGIYYARFKHQGKQIHRSLKTNDKAIARRLLLDMRRELENVTSDEASKLRFDTMAARWLASIRPNLKPKTFTNYAHSVEMLKPYFSITTLAGITAAHCEAWKARRGDSMARGTNPA